MRILDHNTRHSKPPPWLLLVLAAFAARALWAYGLLRRMPLVSDAASYAEEASRLLRSFPGEDAFYWPPGNPLVLAGFFAALGEGVGAARLMGVLLGAATVPLVAFLGAYLARGAAPRLVALCAGGLWALYLPSVMLAGQPYAQHLSALCLTGLACSGALCLRSGAALPALLAGLCLGFGCLTRPSMLFLAPLCLLIWLLRLRAARAQGEPLRRLLVSGVLFGLVSGALVLPALIHNSARGAGLVLSTNNERNFFLGNNPYTPNYKTSHLGQRSLAQLPDETREYLQSFYRRPDARGAMTREALRYILQNPHVTALRTWNRALSFWGFDYLASRQIQEQYRKGKKALLVLLCLEAGSYGLVMVLALLGLCCLHREMDRILTLGLLGVVLGYQLPYLLAFSGGTYHFPVVPLLIPFAGITLARVLSPGGLRALWARLRESRLALVALLFFALLNLQYAYYALRYA